MARENDPDGSGFSRRGVLTGGAIVATQLAGCTGLLGNDDSPSDAPPEEQNPPGGTTETSTPTEKETPTPDPLEQTHQATELDTVVQELEQNSITLDLQPKNEDAEYAESQIFEQYQGELTVELDLNQANQQRHHNNYAATHPEIEEFVENINDPEWRQQILEEAGVNDPSPEIWGNWNTYTDESLSYGERIRQSNMWAFWYEFEEMKLDGISSTNNQYKAQALQGIEQQAGFDTFVWDYGIPGHGLVGAIENPTRKPENTDEQETYIVETDFGDPESQQVATWENSQYQHEELHPAREGVDRDSTTEGFYGLTAIGKDEAELYESVNVPMDMAEEFIEFFKNPENSPAYNHLDPITTAAYIAEENIVNGETDGQVSLDADSIRYNA